MSVSSSSSTPNVKSVKSKLFAKDDLPMGTPKPKSMFRPSQWTDEVEEHYRFQLAGYKDEVEYKALGGEEAHRWPHNNYVKRLRRKSDGYFYYYNKERECSEKDINRTKVYVY